MDGKVTSSGPNDSLIPLVPETSLEEQGLTALEPNHLEPRATLPNQNLNDPRNNLGALNHATSGSSDSQHEQNRNLLSAHSSSGSDRQRQQFEPYMSILAGIGCGLILMTLLIIITIK